jgi:hypothetical protein
MTVVREALRFSTAAYAAAMSGTTGGLRDTIADLTQKRTAPLYPCASS